MAALVTGADPSARGFAETKDLRIASLGNVDAGKSTLTSCLCRGILDDGRGKARSYILRHQHEQRKGQSSSVTMTLTGYRDDEQVLPSGMEGRRSQNKDHYDVASRATHRLQFVDLCGHEKYLKSSIYGLTAMVPDAVMVVVGADRGIQRMTREHVGLACALKIPFFVVLTKIDMAPPEVLTDVQTKLRRLLKRAGRKAFMIRESSDVPDAVKCMEVGQTSFAPVAEVSCVAGTNMEPLRKFIKMLTITKTELVTQVGTSTESKAVSTGESGEIPIMTPLDEASSSQASEASISANSDPLNVLLDESYSPPGVGVVVGGTVRSGVAHVGQKLWVGPTKTGDWFPVQARSIMRQCVPSKAVYNGQHGTFALKSLTKIPLRREMFRKGMVMADEVGVEKARKHTVYEFEAEIKVLHHSTTIDKGYSPFIHLAGSRQSARIQSILSDTGEEVLARTGSQVSVRFRFLHYPEYVEIDRPMVFREGSAKGCGQITAIFDEGGRVVASSSKTPSQAKKHAKVLAEAGIKAEKECLNTQVDAAASQIAGLDVSSDS
mmetsp:Transcript_13744/g.24529  ORF Transcript_13744/g.24529 Transcript_13744/m.24529 type:complete len:549 (-) Transcript_13744:110-1756(-)